jgi:hypothetical protein
VCVCVCVCVCVYVCVCVCVYVYMSVCYLCACVRMCLYPRPVISLTIASTTVGPSVWITLLYSANGTRVFQIYAKSVRE